jgi:replicative DNA helicase Mcm
MSDRYNMSEEKAEEIIKILKRKGIIFEPQQGYLKIV